MGNEKKKITITLGKTLWEDMEETRKSEGLSRSELVRKTIDFYLQHREIREIGSEELKKYLNLLTAEDHVLLDKDRWLTFLEHIDLDSEEFKQNNKEVTLSHKREFTSEIESLKSLFKRLERCNLFRLKKISENSYILSTDTTAVDFVEKLVQNYADILDYEIETEKSTSKIRVTA